MINQQIILVYIYSREFLEIWNYVNSKENFKKSVPQLRNYDGIYFIFCFEDGRHAWVARGGALEVVSTATGQRIAAWCFGAITRDTHTVITCITETRNHVDKTPCLLVGLQTGAHSGMLCLFELKGSKLLKAIDIP